MRNEASAELPSVASQEVAQDKRLEVMGFEVYLIALVVFNKVL